MADYSKFKNSNGDDLVLQDSRVDAISEKVEGIEAGAEVNKIESISIDDTELEPDVNKNVNIELDGRWLHIDEDNCIYVSPSYGEGTGGLHCDSNYGLSVAVDDSTIGIYHDGGNLHVYYDTDTITTANGNGLEVANPVPDPKGSHPAANGDVLTYNATSDEIVWAAPTTLHVDDDTIKNTNGTLSVNYGTGLTVYGYAGENKLCVANPVPTFTTADAGKVLTINAAGNGLEWALPNVPANAVSLNNEPVGVNGDYFTVGEGQ